MENGSRNSSASQPEAFDHRLACLKTAILEDWSELEAAEVDGALVVRIKEAARFDNPAEAPEYIQIHKQTNARPWRELVGTH